MPNQPLKERYLPTRDICYAYGAAMAFAQALEQNLRAFLYTMDYHGVIEEIQLTDKEQKRFKDFDGFIDKSTCGLLIEKLRKTKAIRSQSALKIFVRACEHRNRLAHSYLMEHDFQPNMSDTDKDNIIKELNMMTMDLYLGYVISQAIRELADNESDRRERVWATFNEELGFPSQEDIKRKYVTPHKPKK